MEHKIGAQMTDDGADFFGTDALNALLAGGARIVRIDPGETLLEAVEEEEDAYAVSGFELVVTLADDAPALLRDTDTHE